MEQSHFSSWIYRKTLLQHRKYTQEEMKFVAVTILVVSLYVAVECVQGPPNVKIWGERINFDRRVYYKILKQDRWVFSNYGIATDEVFFPNKVCNANELIKSYRDSYMTIFLEHNKHAKYHNDQDNGSVQRWKRHESASDTRRTRIYV